MMTQQEDEHKAELDAWNAGAADREGKRLKQLEEKIRDAVMLLSCALTHGLAGLSRACCIALAKLIVVENVLQILSISIDHKQQELRNFCYAFVRMHYSKMQVLGSFQQQLLQNPQMLRAMVTRIKSPRGLPTIASVLENSNFEEAFPSSESDSLDTHLLQMLHLSQYSDTKIVVEGGEGRTSISIPTHACILMESPVFRAMLSSQMVEKRTGTICISDATAAQMSAMVRFLYGHTTHFRSIKPDVETLVQQLPLADKYDIAELAALCISGRYPLVTEPPHSI
jgi:hypothetical protein